MFLQVWPVLVITPVQLTEGRPARDFTQAASSKKRDTEGVSGGASSESVAKSRGAMMAGGVECKIGETLASSGWKGRSWELRLTKR